MNEHDNGYDPYNSATTRKAPPIPDWLRNNPDSEWFAYMIHGMTPPERGEWTTGERYRK